MATYEKVGINGTIKQIEVPLYGSDRVGRLYKHQIKIPPYICIAKYIKHGGKCQKRHLKITIIFGRKKQFRGLKPLYPLRIGLQFSDMEIESQQRS
jgi:hypothetical protein